MNFAWFTCEFFELVHEANEQPVLDIIKNIRKLILKQTKSILHLSLRVKLPFSSTQLTFNLEGRSQTYESDICGFRATSLNGVFFMIERQYQL